MLYAAVGAAAIVFFLALDRGLIRKKDFIREYVN
jgi:hypothetical protein